MPNLVTLTAKGQVTISGTCANGWGSAPRTGAWLWSRATPLF